MNAALAGAMGRVVLVMVRGPATVSVRVCVAVRPAMSETLRTKEEVPWLGGLPVREDPIKERPAGRAPAAIVQV